MCVGCGGCGKAATEPSATVLAGAGWAANPVPLMATTVDPVQTQAVLRTAAPAAAANETRGIDNRWILGGLLFLLVLVVKR